MVQEPALKALLQAQAVEQEGLQFYRQVAERLQDDKAGLTLIMLARDEQDHLRMVQAQLQALRDGKGWLSFPEVTAVEPIDWDKPLFPKEREALEAIPAESSDLDALRYGLGIESRSWELYFRAAQATSDPRGQAMYQYLAHAERQHFIILMMRFEGVAGPSGWTY